ncbi:MAG: T9SS type A sorting domain-containing protein [Saprospirales bacterium]|nr:T9SS type A sorting domain-containing protein [Saprospirales bacterium]
MRKLHLLLPLLFMVFSLNKAYSQVVQALPVNFLSPGDFFGVSVDINGNGDYIVVGAPFHINYADVPPDQEGVAFVYSLSGNTWTLKDTLDVPAFEVMDGVGTAVAINTNGDRIAVGAPGVGNDRGDARVFKRIGNAWAMLPSLHYNGNSGDNTGAGPGDNFGSVLALDGSGYYMAVGSPSFQNQYGRANVCYFNVFLNHWEQYESLENPTPDKSDYFGCSIALDATGNFLVVGALGEDNGNGNNNIDDHYGAVYYYTRSGINIWTKIQDIAPLGLQSQSMFGASVDLNKAGDTLIVGAPGHKGSGAAFLFKKMGGLWVQTDVISAHNPVAEDLFGSAVALSGTGDIAMIGAPLRDTSTVEDIGSAFLFSYVNPTVHWGQKNNLSLPPGYEAGETFGSSVAIARNLFLGVVGSPFQDNFRGAAYVVWPSALPVTWLSFRAEPVNDAVNLYWSTASESNNEGFGVERSANGRDWETIAFVPGAGTTSEVQTYHFTDESPVTSHQSLIYYRLKQTDYDGAFEYSPIRVVEFGDAGLGVRVYPNPASDWATLSFAEPTKVRGTVQILHENGRLMAEYDIPPQTQDYQIRLAPLASGTYLLKVKVGALEWSNRLVVE